MRRSGKRNTRGTTNAISLIGVINAHNITGLKVSEANHNPNKFNIEQKIRRVKPRGLEVSGEFYLATLAK